MGGPFTESDRIEELAAAQADFERRVFDSADAEIAVVGPDGVILRTNAAWQRFARDNGADPARASGVGASYYVPYAAAWGDTTQAEEAFAGVRAVQDGRVPAFDLEYPCNLPSGAARWFAMRVVPLRGADGTVLVAHLDITRRKVAEEALQRSYAMLARTESMAQVGSWEWDVATDTVTWSDELFRLFRLDPAAGAPSFADHGRLYQSDDLARLGAAVAEAVRAGTPYELELRGLEVDGKTRTYAARGCAERSASGTVIRLFGSLQDITERKQAEEGLRQSERRLHFFTDSVPAVLAYVDARELRYLLVNKAFAELFGCAEEEVRGKYVRDVLGEVAYARALPFIERARAGERVTYDVVIAARGGPRWYSVGYTPEFAEHGAVQNLIVLAIDINARKRAEEEKEKLEVLNRQLQKSDSLGRMAGAIAHHFNNKLMAVMGNLELALDRLPKDGVAFEVITDAMTAARDAAAVSSMMLTYLGKATATRAPLDLAAACRRDLPWLQSLMPSSVEVETDLPTAGPIVSVDANQIRQVLVNLVTNAWEASDGRPSRIRLAVTTAQPSAIAESGRFPVDSATRHSAYACLEVTDTGAGIAAANIERCFDPFFSTKFVGRGMGLAAVLGIVRAHDGVITVASEPGQGSTFRAYLPLPEEPVQRPAVAPADAPAVGDRGVVGLPRGGTLLVVDDEEMIRNVVVVTLTDQGFTVLAARDGVEAVEVFRHHPEIQCVLCDLTMPRMGGWETLTALRGIAPGLPVILVSGYSEAQVMAGDHPERPHAFLSKPFDRDQLEDAIRRALAPRPR